MSKFYYSLLCLFPFMISCQPENINKSDLVGFTYQFSELELDSTEYYEMVEGKFEQVNPPPEALWTAFEAGLNDGFIENRYINTLEFTSKKEATIITFERNSSTPTVQPSKELDLEYSLGSGFLKLHFEDTGTWTMNWDDTNGKLFSYVYTSGFSEEFPNGTSSFAKDIVIAGYQDKDAILTQIEKNNSYQNGDTIALNVSKFWFEK